MKKILAILLASAMLFMMCACSSGISAPVANTAPYGTAQYFYIEAQNAGLTGDAELYYEMCVMNGGYADAKEKLAEIKYEKAQEYLLAGRLTFALDELGYCVDYSDGRALAENCLLILVDGELQDLLKKYQVPVLNDLEPVEYALDMNEFADYLIAGITINYTSEEFESLSDENKLAYFELFLKGRYIDWINTTITTSKGVYSFQNIDRSYYLLRDGNQVFSHLVIESVAYAYSTSSGKCPNCNGRKLVRTYATNSPWDSGYVIGCPLCS